ncbi:uncharacterized protein LOC135840459 [Planococcus citri]|uniref:uncharacterized protein LOC135840459 n=1 Tax=Planococcus citri TaxID=170843 RepID=UPI0031F8B706
MIEDMVFIFLLAIQPSTVLLQGSSDPNLNATEPPKTFFLDVSSYRFNEFERTLIYHNHLFVDKTMFIEELINLLEKCELISRPSRWGKTFNMAMTASFFDIPHHEDGSVDEHKRNMVRSFFAGGAKIVLPNKESPIEMKPLKISKIENAMDEIGNHPTILISFVDSGNTYDEFIMNFADKIRGLIVRRNYVAFLPQYCQFCDYPEECYKLLNSTSEELASSPLDIILHHSIEILTSLLSRHFRFQAVILIDEYDYPLNRMTYDSEDSNKTTEFLKSLIGCTFKGGSIPDIYRGVVTGVLQFSRAKIFSRLAVCRDCSVTKPQYSAHFGFTEENVQTLIENNPSFPHNLSQLKNWYDGYTFEKNRLYNPLSIRMCLVFGDMGSYWIESVPNPMSLNPGYGKNPLHQPFMLDSYQRWIQQLFVNEPIMGVDLQSEIYYKYEYATESLDFFLSLLTSLGYLTYEETSQQRYMVRIPNKEVRDFAIKNCINLWAMKYVCEEFVIIDKILFTILESFKVNDVDAVQHSLSRLLSKINETAPAKHHCELVFGLLAKFSDIWDLERSFDEVNIYEQVTFQCSITLRLKLDNCYNTDLIAINFIINGDSTMEQNIIEAKTPTSDTLEHVIPNETFSIQEPCTEAETRPTINRRTTGVSKHIAEIKNVIKEKVMEYSEKRVVELMEKSKSKAAELTEKRCKYIWHTCIVIGKNILGMFRH